MIGNGPEQIAEEITELEAEVIEGDGRLRAGQPVFVKHPVHQEIDGERRQVAACFDRQVQIDDEVAADRDAVGEAAEETAGGHFVQRQARVAGSWVVQVDIDAAIETGAAEVPPDAFPGGVTVIAVTVLIIDTGLNTDHRRRRCTEQDCIRAVIVHTGGAVVRCGKLEEEQVGGELGTIRQADFEVQFDFRIGRVVVEDEEEAFDLAQADAEIDVVVERHIDAGVEVEVERVEAELELGLRESETADEVQLDSDAVRVVIDNGADVFRGGNVGQDHSAAWSQFVVEEFLQAGGVRQGAGQVVGDVAEDGDEIAGLIQVDGVTDERQVGDDVAVHGRLKPVQQGCQAGSDQPDIAFL